jgi:plastocyanin
VKGVRALASGMLVLAATCTVPALSAAQDAATTTNATTTTTTATTPVEPSSPAPPDAPPAESSAGDPRRTPSEPSENGEAASIGVPAAAPAAVASASSAPKARKSASASVSVGDNFYAPTSVTVAVGDTVTWNNNGQAPHSATADDGSFDTGVFDPGGRRSVSFDSAGTFSYYCTVHGQAQSGTVRVLASSGGGGGGGGGGGASSSDDSATSEASAVASPDAAGDANTLPMTGMAVGGLAVVGFALLALGLLARQADPERSRRRWLPIF